MGDQDEVELPYYSETIYWEPDPDLDNMENQSPKDLTNYGKARRESVLTLHLEQEAKELEKEAANSQYSPHQMP